MKGSERTIALVAEEGASLSSGSLRLYASLITHHSSLNAQKTQPLSHSATLPLIVGCIDLYAYDPLNRRCAVGIMVANEYRRQGYALAMLHALENLYSPTQPLSNSATQPLSNSATQPLSNSATQPLSNSATQPLSNSATQPPSHSSPLHTLYADIAAPNTASINLFRKAGYEECGRFKEWLELDSHFIDNIRMQKIL
ncbi:MAG: GNAT family N-acetyltransferase [Bacteroidales bacterium]|nr:GNAT family N-acetyltransferase [Bacteroidales bacterium]